MAAEPRVRSHITIDIDDSRKLIRITIKERLSDTDLIELDAQRRLMPDFQSGFAVLSECLDISHTSLTWKGIYQLATTTQSDLNRVAIVTDHPVIFGIASTYTVCANWKDNRVAVFSNVPQALEWLGMPD
jgi:hypothetical protein